VIEAFPGMIRSEDVSESNIDEAEMGASFR
jgi:hypothetical protein